MVFGSLVRTGFLELDDPLYITQNPLVTGGLGWAGVKAAFSSFHAGYWIPVTWTVLAAEYSAFGPSPSGYHAVSIALHAANTLLVYAFLARATGKRSGAAAAALLFAVHPLAVEPVAWACSQKDLLFTVFFLSGMTAYLAYGAKPSAGRYGAVTVLFALSLAAKPMAVTFPAALLLLDHWPLGRLSRRSLGRLLVEKIPWIVMAAAVSVATVFAHRAFGALPAGPGLGERLVNAIFSAGWYAVSTVLPYRLAVFYPYPAAGIAWYKPALAGGCLIATALVFFRMKTKPFLAVGLLFFLVTLLPASGILQAGAQAMADRFAYLPRLGLILILVYGGSLALARLRITQAQAAVFVAVAIAGYGVLCKIQTGFWQDRITLYTHALSVTQDNYIAENRLGRAFQEKGDLDAAIARYRKAAAIAPSYAAARNNIAGIYMARGMFGEAQGELSDFIRKYPEKAGPEIYNNLGAAAGNGGDAESAVRWFQKAAEAYPDNFSVHVNLGNAYFMNHEMEKAKAEYEKARAIEPDNLMIKKRLDVFTGKGFRKGQSPY
ncbi:MAG: tetratricopeptide repeat protein [Thermodesulfobacteriota bacterium]